VSDTKFQVLRAALNIFLVIGPTGAGKTTLLRALLRQGFFPGKVARIYNDDGSTDGSGELLVDAGALVDGETLEPLMAGCFGCQDKGSFFDVMDKIRAAGCCNWVVIDPLGFVSGDEVTGVVHEWAQRAHEQINLKVLGVLNTAEIEEAQALGALESQLAVTSVGVALNRVPGGVTSIEDERLARVLEIIDASGASAPVFLLSDNLTLPSSVATSVHGRAVSRLRPKVLHTHHDHSTCGHDHGHGDHHHGHDHSHAGHDHHHGHGHSQYVRLHFLLRPGLDRRAVVEWFDAYFACTPDHGVFRMKGSASDLEVQRGFKTWGDLEVPATTQQPFLTLYVKETGSATLEDFVEIMALAHASGKVHGSTRALLRRDDLSPEQNDHLVRWVMSQLPKSVVMTVNGPVTNPELLELLNEVRKRKGVDPALNAEAIQRRVAYYFDCLAVLRPDTPCWNAVGASERKRMLAIGVGWFCARKAEEVGAVLLRRAHEEVELLVQMLADGLRDLEAHNSDIEVAIEAAEETADTVRFLLGNGDPTQVRLMLSSPLDHALELARRDSRSGLVEAWDQACNLVR
jgi:G3E family GTPase